MTSARPPCPRAFKRALLLCSKLLRQASAPCVRAEEVPPPPPVDDAMARRRALMLGASDDDSDDDGGAQEAHAGVCVHALATQCTQHAVARRRAWLATMCAARTAPASGGARRLRMPAARLHTTTAPPAPAGKASRRSSHAGGRTRRSMAGESSVGHLTRRSVAGNEASAGRATRRSMAGDSSAGHVTRRSVAGNEGNVTRRSMGGSTARRSMAGDDSSELSYRPSYTTDGAGGLSRKSSMAAQDPGARGGQLSRRQSSSGHALPVVEQADGCVCVPMCVRVWAHAAVGMLGCSSVSCSSHANLACPPTAACQPPVPAPHWPPQE